MNEFRTELGRTIFEEKYKNCSGNCGTWSDLVDTLVTRVCKGLMINGDITQLARYIKEFKFVPAGRYLYYAGRKAAFFNNCYSLIAEDSREGWADLSYKHMMGLMCGGGVGTYYGKIRPSNSIVNTTGGVASGPIPLMIAMNELGRNVMQGGSRRSALYASLPCDHPDIFDFMVAKNWDDHTIEQKIVDFNYPANLDMTNISVAYNNIDQLDSVQFKYNILQALTSGEPGFQFDFNAPNEVGRNACTEFISDMDSDVCNLGSINIANIIDDQEMNDVTYLASQFLYCGTIRATLPYEQCVITRTIKPKIGIGLMGLHEWFIKNNIQYGPSEQLKVMLNSYKHYSELGADYLSDKLNTPKCVRYRSVAPSGTISILAGTTSGIEPLYSVAMKRRWYDRGTWKYQYVVDPIASDYINKGINTESIETAATLEKDIERRIAMQVFIQKYVDMGISSTINISGSICNSTYLEDTENIVKKYAKDLRGLTFYPNNSRAGQPLVPVELEEAISLQGETMTEQIKVLDNSCKSGVCGI